MESIDDKKYVEDNFFIISSDNLCEVRSRIYGFAIADNRIYINSDECNCWLPYDCYGSFVNVIIMDGNITIQQDYFGSYGLYLYNEDGYFVVSNSFLYLVNYLKIRRRLTFDHEFAKAFLAAPQAILSYTQTMVKEIIMLPRNCSVQIDCNQSNIEIQYYEQREHYIPIDSREGINIVDSWHFRWNQILKTIIEKKKKISFSLSGGKDSRISLSALFKPRLRLDEIYFRSTQDDLSTHSDDYRIASEIAEQYGFKLNTGFLPEHFKMNPWTNLEMSLFAKCGFHREIMPTFFWNRETEFRVTGVGGDLRDFWNESADDFIDRQCRYTIYNSVNSREALRQIMLRAKREIDNSNYINSKEYTACDYFYKYGRQRNHNGKANVELHLANVVMLSPLMDPVLYKLCQDIGRDNNHDLLYALILNRFLPEIQDMPFDSNREIKSITKKIASEINTKYPLKNDVFKKDIFMMDILFKREIPRKSNDSYDTLDCHKRLFYSDEIKRFTYDVFGEEIYFRADQYYRTKLYHPYIAASGIVQTYAIFNATEISKSVQDYSSICISNRHRNEFDIPINYYNSGLMKEVFDFLCSARIDIKNYGTHENNLVVDCLDDKVNFITAPRWFKNDEGQGKVIQSCKGKIVIRIKTICDGIMKIKLIGPWMKDMNDNPLGIKIDFNELQLIDEDTGIDFLNIQSMFTVDSQNGKVYEIKCKHMQTFILKTTWLPHIYKEQDLNELLHKLCNINLDNFLFWKEVKDDYQY